MRYRAKITRVVAPHIVDADIYLGQGVTIHRRVWLSDVEEVREEEPNKRATHCLVVMVGGKRGIVVDIPEEPSGKIEGVILRKMEDDFQDFFNDFADALDPEFVNVNSYMVWLSTRGYAVSDVKNRLIKKYREAVSVE